MEIQVMQDILGKNDEVAAENQALFAAKKVFALNLLGSPGAGKTTLLEKTMAALKDELRMAVIEGDLFTTKDADRIARYGVPVIQINTSGGCHLDAPMIDHMVDHISFDEPGILFIENVGNLVCPAEFSIGEHVKMLVSTVTEGSDKPYKYPLAFEKADIIILNKVDLIPYLNFDEDFFMRGIRALNPSVPVFKVSGTTGEGFEQVARWLTEKAAALEIREHHHDHDHDHHDHNHDHDHDHDHEEANGHHHH